MSSNLDHRRTRLRRSSEHPAGDAQDLIRPRRKSGSFWKVCAARTASPSCVAAKGIARNLYYRWSKDFLEAGKKR